MKQTALITALLAGLCLPLTASAATDNVTVYGTINISASAYKVTISGTLDSNLTGTFDNTFGYDLRNWLGKTYSVQFILDNNPANATASGTYAWGISNVDNWWSFNNLNARLDIGGSTVFSGLQQQNEITTMNNAYVPQSMPGLPSGLVADRDFDGLFLQTGHFVGCMGGTCNGSPTQIQESLWISADHVWDTLTAIPNNNLPDLLNAAPSFAGAVYKGFSVQAGRWSPAGGDNVAYSLNGSIASVTITPVPEPETYAMLLAGLGVLGWKLRNRR